MTQQPPETIDHHNTVIVGIDYGGTKGKGALVYDNGALVPATFVSVSSRQGDSREEILTALRSLILDLTVQAGARDLHIKAIGIAFPSPFDYANGVSLVAHKFKNIYGVSLKEELECGLPTFFLNDAQAFGIGCHVDCEDEQIIAITLGTGLGGYFGRGKGISSGVIPPGGEIWDFPYNGDILERFVSTKAIIEVYGQNIEVAEIAKRANHGDAAALNAFAMLGMHLGNALATLADDFNASRIMVGGGIAGSFDELIRTSMTKSFSATTRNLVLPKFQLKTSEGIANVGAAMYALKYMSK